MQFYLIRKDKEECDQSMGMIVLLLTFSIVALCGRELFLLPKDIWTVHIMPHMSLFNLIMLSRTCHSLNLMTTDFIHDNYERKGIYNVEKMYDEYIATVFFAEAECLKAKIVEFIEKLKGDDSESIQILEAYKGALFSESRMVRFQPGMVSEKQLFRILLRYHNFEEPLAIHFLLLRLYSVDLLLRHLAPIDKKGLRAILIYAPVLSVSSWLKLVPIINVDNEFMRALKSKKNAGITCSTDFCLLSQLLHGVSKPLNIGLTEDNYYGLLPLITYLLTKKIHANAIAACLDGLKLPNQYLSYLVMVSVCYDYAFNVYTAIRGDDLVSKLQLYVDNHKAPFETYQLKDVRNVVEMAIVYDFPEEFILPLLGYENFKHDLCLLIIAIRKNMKKDFIKALLDSPLEHPYDISEMAFNVAGELFYPELDIDIEIALKIQKNTQRVVRGSSLFSETIFKCYPDEVSAELLVMADQANELNMDCIISITAWAHQFKWYPKTYAALFRIMVSRQYDFSFTEMDRPKRANLRRFIEEAISDMDITLTYALLGLNSEIHTLSNVAYEVKLARLNPFH